MLTQSDKALIDNILSASIPNYLNKIIFNRDNTNVSDNVSDSYKRQVNFELTHSKQQIIKELEKCDYRTQPKITAQLLEKLFKEWKSKDGHWLFIAQKWNPRAINRTISRLLKLYNAEQETIENIAAYFTYLIKFRKKRRSLNRPMIAVNSKKN